MNQKQWVTPEEASKLLPWTPQWIRRNIEKFTATHREGKVLIRMDSVKSLAPGYEPGKWVSRAEAAQMLGKSRNWLMENQNRMVHMTFGVCKFMFLKTSVLAMAKNLRDAKKKYSNRKRTNDVGTSIEKFIEQERTLIFDNLLVANKAAREMNSSAYPVYENGFTNGEYAVPK